MDYLTRRQSTPFFQHFKDHPFVSTGLFATVSVLAVGVWNIGKNPDRANKLMWMRIGFQALTLCMAVGSVLAIQDKKPKDDE